ncbi:MAG: hypothetical protein EZS28_014735, partial [Streblomastix strix]
FYSGQYHGIKSGFRIKSFESQLTFDGKLRQPELYQIQAIKQDHGQLNLLYGLFVGIPSGFRIKGLESYVTIGSTQTVTFTNLKQLYQFKGTLNCVKFKFPGMVIKNFTEFQIRAEEANVIIGSVDIPTNQITGMQQGKRSTTIYLHKCKTVTVQKVTLANNTNHNSASTVIISITPVMYVEAFPDTKLTIADCVFQNNCYSGRGDMSGAVYIDFIDNLTSTEKGYIRFFLCKFIRNTGTISGAIMFRGKGSNDILFSQVMFIGNGLTKGINFNGLAASCIFTYDDLGKQLGNNPFCTCYSSILQQYIQYSTDIRHGNQEPIFLQKEDNYQIPYLNASSGPAYVSMFDFGNDVYQSFIEAVDHMTNIGGTIILLGDQFTIQAGVTIAKYQEITINPYQGIPTLFNQGGQTIPFNVHVQISGRNPINDPDSGVIVGSSDNPLKTINYAVNLKDKVGDLTVILYRQIYPLQSPLWINDDNVYIKDENQYQNKYDYINKSVISSTIGSSNAFSIKEGSLVLNAINIDVTNSISPFVLVFITGQGSFEMNNASISMSSNNSKLIECIHAITSLKLLNINPISATGLSQSSSLIDLILNSNSKFELCNTSMTSSNNLRYITINLQDKPSNININKVQFNQLGQDDNAKVAQIYGTKIIPEQVFSLCSILDSTSFHPLLQIPEENYSGQYDNLLLIVKWTNQQLFYLLPTELFSSITVNNTITFIGANSIFQTETSAQLNVVNEGHLTVRGVTFNQMAQGSSIITSSSANSFIILEDVCFQIAQKKNFESILEYLPSSRIRKDFTKLKNKYQQIDYDYYLRSLDKIGTAQILSNSFVNITFGYSLSLSNIKFGEWIVTDDIPLIDANGPLQHFLVENMQIKHIGRQYGGPHILNLNIYPSGEAKIKNVTIDGRGWVHLSNWMKGINNKNTQNSSGKLTLDQKQGKQIGKYIINEIINNTLNVDFTNEFKWKYPAIKVNGGKLRVSDSKFVGLGVDGALVLEDLEAYLANSTRFEENDALNTAKAEGLNKNIIPSEYKSASDEEDSDKQIDEDDRQLKELRRYRGYVKNLLAYGKTTLKAHNVSFIGEKLSQKKKSFKEGYSLQIQHQSEVRLTGEIGESNNAFGVPEITYVKTQYIKGAEKDIGNGKIEKIVQIEIRTKGLLIPGVEWFLELQNKKDPEDNKRTFHYNLLHRKVWEEGINQENLEGWYLIENQNHVNIKKIASNSYPINEFDGKVFVQWLSEKVILLRLTHIEIKSEKKSNVDKIIEPDSDRYIKDWQLRLGIEKRKDQQGQKTDPKIKWTPLDKLPFPVIAIMLIIIGIIIFIPIVIAIILNVV